MSIKFKVFMFVLILQATELLKLTHPFLMAIIKPCVLLLSLNDDMVFFFAFNVAVPIKQIMLVNVKLNFHSPNGYSLCLGQPPYQHFVVNKLMWNLPVEFFSENVWVGFSMFGFCNLLCLAFPANYSFLHSLILCQATKFCSTRITGVCYSDVTVRVVTHDL